MGANYSFYVKTIETHARTFFKVTIFSIGSVCVGIANMFIGRTSLPRFTFLNMSKQSIYLASKLTDRKLVKISQKFQICQKRM